MAKLLSRYLLPLCILISSAVFGHSVMFPDTFKFDDSDEGQPALMMQALAHGDVSAAVATACVGGNANGYPCRKIDFQSFLAKASMGGGSANLNDIWGWTDPLTGREFAIVGRTNGTSFVDITDAANPVFIGYLRAHNNGSGSWRDMKVYNDHVFIVGDGSGNATHGLQVFDLNTLRNTSPGANLSETAHLGGFGPAHNIAINEDTGYAYIVGSNRCSGGLYMVDISNPTSPSFAGCFSADGYTHDVQCVVYAGPDSRYVGREICAAYNEDTITFVDVTNKSNPVQVSRNGYSGARYTHQGWFLNDNHEYLIMNDELDEQRNGANTTSYVWNVRDLRNPFEIGRYVGPTTAIDHNLYTKDGYVFEANYRAGLRILSTEDITSGNLEEVAFFDTIPGSNSAQFSGAWSSYVYFESGNIIVSDIGNGLFVLAPDWDAIGPTPTPSPTPSPTPLPGECFYQATFENSNDGWSNSNNSSCSTGTFVRGAPTETSSGGTTLQVAGAADGSSAWFTASNSSIGVNDVDGGTCETLSPAISAGNAESVEISLAYFHGQRDPGDDSTDGFIIEVLNNGNVVNTLVNIGDVTSNAQWRNVSATVTNPGSIQIRARATDGAGPGDIVEAGIDQVSVCPLDATNPTPTPTPTATPAPTCSVEEGFESGAGGWSNSTASSCSTGNFVTGSPTQQSNGGVTTQVGSANTGNSAYYTATNSSVGVNDVDGGNCIATSPTYSVPTNSTLNIAYFHGQRDAGDDSSDFFNLELSTDGGNTFSSLAANGDSVSNARWENTSAQISGGSNVVLRVQCSDGSGAGDLVECGIDDLNICPN